MEPTTNDDDYSDTWSHPPDVEGRAVKRQRTERGPWERGVMREGNESGLPRFIGSGSGVHLIRTVFDVLARTHTGSSQSRHVSTAADLVPGEEDQLISPPSGLQSRAGLPVSPFWQSDEIASGVTAVDFDNLLQWTESYFEHWHPAFPFLHGPAFLGVLEQVSENGIKTLGQADAVIVRSVLSISLADSRQMGSRRHPFPSNLLFLSQDDISASLAYMLGSPASTSNIQAALCVQLFLISMLNFSMASRVGGIIVRMAFHLGLHRCPSRYPNFTAHEATMRRRLWWSIYCLDRLVCQTLGSPLGIRDDDLDVCLPSEEIHNHMKVPQRNDAALQVSQQHENGQLQLLEMLSKHAKLRGMILELRNKSINYRRDDSGRALRVQAELRRWANEVYDLTSTHSLLQGGSEDGDRPLSDAHMSSSQRVLLVILQQELILSFYRPLLVSDLDTPSSQAAFQECINASKVIIDTASEASQTSAGNEVDLRHSYLLWPSLTWSIWMSCFVLTYAAIERIATAISAKRYANRALSVLKLLSLRKTLWPDKCILAIEQLITFLNQVSVHEKHSTSPAARPQTQTRIAKPKQYAETSRTLATPSQPSSQVSSQEDRRCPLPRQPRLDEPATVNWQPQTLRTSVGTTLLGTTDTQDHSSSNFSDTFPNLTLDYADTLGITDRMYADPLLALDFANFAQDPETQGMTDYNFGQNGFS